MKLSILIPVYNEEKYIEETLKKVFSVVFPYPKEVIVINDGSIDDTELILERLSKKYNFKKIQHAKNLGKGEAIKTGLHNTKGNLIIIQDADLEYDPKDIPLLLAKMDTSISAVYGKRNTRKWGGSGFHYALGAKIITSSINILYGTNLKDAYTGYKLFNIDKMGINFLKNLKSPGFEFEAEVTCKILKEKGKIVEVGINYVPRSKKEGKHISLLDAFKGLSTVIKIKFSRSVLG